MPEQESVFSHMLTRRCHTGLTLANRGHLLFYGMVHLGPVDTTTSITMIVEVLKHVSKSRATVTILKFGRLEGRYNFFMIVLACGTFVNLFNIVSSFVKLVSLSIYRCVCLMLVLVVVLGLRLRLLRANRFGYFGFSGISV